jgi:hypothetical protein
MSYIVILMSFTAISPSIGYGHTELIVATRAAQQPGLLVRKHSARGGEDLYWNEGFSEQHDKKHDINNKTYG